MKIYTKVVFNWNPEIEQYEETYAETYDYDGDVDLCQEGTGLDKLLSTLPSLILQMQALGIKEDEAENLHTYRMDELKLRTDKQNFDEESKILEDVKLFPTESWEEAINKSIFSGDIQHPEVLSRAKSMAAGASKTMSNKKEISDIYMSYSPPPVVPGEPLISPADELSGAVDHFSRGVAEASSRGFVPLSNAIGQRMEGYIKLESNRMIRDSTADLIDYFVGTDALSTEQGDLFKKQVGAGGAASILPQVTALLSSDVLTTDEARTQLTGIATMLNATMQAMSKADMVIPNSFTTSLTNINETILGSMEEAVGKLGTPSPLPPGVTGATPVTRESLVQTHGEGPIAAAYSFLQSPAELKSLNDSIPQEVKDVVGTITPSSITPDMVSRFMAETDYATDKEGKITFGRKLPEEAAFTKGAQVKVTNWQTGEERTVSGDDAEKLVETGPWDLTEAMYKEFPSRHPVVPPVTTPTTYGAGAIGRGFPTGRGIRKPPKEVSKDKMIMHKETRKLYKIVKILSPESMGRPYKIVVKDAKTGKRLAPISYDRFQELYGQPIYTG